MIFVPSKGRAGKSKLLDRLNSSRVHPVNVFVEREELKKYQEAYKDLNFIVLPSSGMGITFVRNFMKLEAERLEFPSYWQIDDDVTGFYIREGTKMIKFDEFEELLNKAEVQFRFRGIALGALDYQQLAWSATKDLNENSFCDVCVWTDVLKTKGLRYDYKVEGKEDRDMAMQVIKSGMKTGRTTLYAFAAPKNGSNEGGLKEIFYQVEGKELRCVKAMIEKWGDEICQHIVKEGGRNDVKIQWKKINSKQQSLF